MGDEKLREKNVIIMTGQGLAGWSTYADKIGNRAGRQEMALKLDVWETKQQQKLLNLTCEGFLFVGEYR
ncbi:MAG: hypothetical protein KGZ57_02675 [Dethiobacter sp.]|nr:hypothetical protein [Dethiobacter sp.]